MPPIFETHIPASRRSNFKLDLAWIFLRHTERSSDLATIPFKIYIVFLHFFNLKYLLLYISETAFKKS